MTDTPKLFVLTGVPGSGKTSAANRIAFAPAEDWNLLHADDFIGPTFAKYPPLQDARSGFVTTMPTNSFSTVSGSSYVTETGATTTVATHWASIRQFHTIFVGESAGWYMSQGRNIFVEGHIKDQVELDNLLEAIPNRYDGPFDQKVVRLEGDVDKIVRYLVDSQHRRHQCPGPNREACLRRWITEWGIETCIADQTVNINGKTPQKVAQDVAAAFGFLSVDSRV
ncbi:MAG: hypothetical protein ABR888_01140 [Thermoplasmata archaeon]|jgi:hypothetical protein